MKIVYNLFAVAPSLNESLGGAKTHAMDGLMMKKIIAPSTIKSSKNEAEMTKVEKTTKPMSWWHMSLGVVVIILAVILSRLLD
jgi:hypothetical protein